MGDTVGALLKQLGASAQVLAELATLDRPVNQDAPVEAAALIDHILERYHAVHREQLPELIRMARRVEAVHREHPQVPRGLADFLDGMEQELLSHMMKEEQVLFPMLKAGGNHVFGDGAGHDEGERGIPAAREVEESDHLGGIRHAGEDQADAENQADDESGEFLHGVDLRSGDG